MAHVYADRVADTSSTTGTSPFALDNAEPTGYRNFDDVCADADTIYYCAAHRILNEWEVGTGTYGAGTNVLTRTTVLSSSNGGSAVSFSSGIKDVIASLPASALSLLSGQALTRTNDTNVTLTLGGTPTTALLAATSLQLGWAGTLAPSRGGTGIANNAASTITVSGNFATTFTVSNTTGVTLPTTGTLATLAGAEELTNKTLNASVGKGTWTTSGTWTLPAFTLGGTVSGGGQQLNNIIIGTVTPLAGAFTTLSTTGALTYGGVTLTNNVTGTGKMVLDTSPTIATPVINSAAHVGGTWVADATWTLPAHTLGGTVTGLLTLATGQIAFPASQNPSADANTLDDYEEGAWSPTITTTGTVGTPAYSVQVGSYEKIGRQVTLRFNITLSGWTGSPTGNVLIGNLPFANNGTANDLGIAVIPNFIVAGLAALNYGMGGVILASASSITLNQFGNTASSAITTAQAGTTPTFNGKAVYHV